MITIKTNNVPRDIIYGYELTDKERAEFDYIEDTNEFMGHSFIRYKGYVYDLSEFITVPEDMVPGQWDGYRSDTFFSGIVIRLVNDNEQVVCGTYIG